MTDEFIDAYSDDQIYLELIERLINEHPIENNIPDNIKYSSFSRLWIVMMVGSIEMAIKKWSESECMMTDIAEYLNDGSNQERLEKLFKAFEIRGLEPERSCFDDFLVCKYIRNAYVHGKWNENQKKYVTNKGFPSSLMSFSSKHYDRIKKSYYHITYVLGMANVMNTIAHSESEL